MATMARALASLANLLAAYGVSVLIPVIVVAQAHLGRLDVVFGNAGYSLLGTIKETRATYVRALCGAFMHQSLNIGLQKGDAMGCDGKRSGADWQVSLCVADDVLGGGR
jgi:hypothetical protein